MFDTSKLDTCILEMKASREAFQKKIQEIINEFFLDFFTDTPEITYFTWSQYTPYFNDGEECVFKANFSYGEFGTIYDEEFPELVNKTRGGESIFCEHWFMNNGGSVTDIRYYEEARDEYNHLIEKISENDLKRIRKNTKNLVDALCLIDDSFVETIWGNHVEVTATREGFNVEEYDHE